MLSLLLTTGTAYNRNADDDMLMRQAALEIESEYLKSEIKQLKSSLSAKDEIEKILKEKGKHRSNSRENISVCILITVSFSSNVSFTYSPTFCCQRENNWL